MNSKTQLELRSSGSLKIFARFSVPGIPHHLDTSLQQGKIRLVSIWRMLMRHLRCMTTFGRCFSGTSETRISDTKLNLSILRIHAEVSSAINQLEKLFFGRSKIKILRNLFANLTKKTCHFRRLGPLMKTKCLYAIHKEGKNS